MQCRTQFIDQGMFPSNNRGVGNKTAKQQQETYSQKAETLKKKSVKSDHIGRLEMERGSPRELP